MWPTFTENLLFHCKNRWSAPVLEKNTQLLIPKYLKGMISDLLSHFDVIATNEKSAQIMWPLTQCSISVWLYYNSDNTEGKTQIV